MKTQGCHFPNQGFPLVANEAALGRYLTRLCVWAPSASQESQNGVPSYLSSDSAALNHVVHSNSYSNS